MCQRLRSIVPITREQLIPSVPDTELLKVQDDRIKERQKRISDDHYGVRNSPRSGEAIVKEEEEALATRDARGPRCYRCGKMGHIKRNCGEYARRPRSPPRTDTGKLIIQKKDGAAKTKERVC